ncbi:MAG: ribbon-helix-helix domain-containing protein [Candidatus Heimdallarchaeota archaeon]
MKIVTINLPQEDVEAINKLVGDHKIYPSRSELVRCALKDYLIRELGNNNDLNDK